MLVNISSLYGRISSPYVTAKWGLQGFSEVLRQELRDTPGIAVCTILPGTVDPPIYRHAANYIGRRIRPLPPVVPPERVVAAVLRMVDHPQAEIVVGRTQPPRRMGTPARPPALRPPGGTHRRPWRPAENPRAPPRRERLHFRRSNRRRLRRLALPRPPPRRQVRRAGRKRDRRRQRREGRQQRFSLARPQPVRPDPDRRSQGDAQRQAPVQQQVHDPSEDPEDQVPNAEVDLGDPSAGRTPPVAGACRGCPG